jgi:hypothetical protein
MTQTPSVGRIVHYTLSKGDVATVDNQIPRRDRNPVAEGQVYPAQIVAVWSAEGCVNLVVQLDGLAQYWATSRSLGDQPGTWSWPPRV